MRFPECAREREEGGERDRERQIQKRLDFRAGESKPSCGIQDALWAETKHLSGALHLLGFQTKEGKPNKAQDLGRQFEDLP